MKFWFRAFGCRVNQCEIEELRARLAEAGCALVQELSEAEVCVVNTCTVTRDADREAFKFLRRLRRDHPKARLVVTGCLATRDPGALRSAFPHALVVDNSGKDALPEALGLSLDPEPRAVARRRSRAFLKIQDGCDWGCSYCVVPRVRPKLWSLAPERAARRVRRLVEEGVPEIVLCGIRLGRYSCADAAGKELDLAGLVARLLELPGTFRLRLSSLELGEAGDRLAGLIADSGGRVCPHLHLPLQSGSDAVLRRMKRPYLAADFALRVEALSRRIPGVALFTDIMTGFPGESEAEFREGLKFVERIGFRGLHVFRYSARPGTPAAACAEQIPPAVARERLDICKELDRSLRQAHLRAAAGQERVAVPLETRSSGVTEDFLAVRLDPQPGPGLWRVRVGAGHAPARVLGPWQEGFSERTIVG
ncbi:MAG TPA: hypothetical protein DEB40_07040 [Elusimicrobia bacterium]|nr:hypothetical protein [Elusimicrobiota bacterium]HBT61483.1 hypothetical protein [Elusimicrobiota bacterium]